MATGLGEHVPGRHDSRPTAQVPADRLLQAPQVAPGVAHRGEAPPHRCLRQGRHSKGSFKIPFLGGSAEVHGVDRQVHVPVDEAGKDVSAPRVQVDVNLTGPFTVDNFDDRAVFDTTVRSPRCWPASGS